MANEMQQQPTTNGMHHANDVLAGDMFLDFLCTELIDAEDFYRYPPPAADYFPAHITNEQVRGVSDVVKLIGTRARQSLIEGQRFKRDVLEILNLVFSLRQQMETFSIALIISKLGERHPFAIYCESNKVAR